ncbi:MAG: McrC family protein [Heliobacteriaceae bacterium]|nr:McrC family protein [Heliobacteriaceae bacterium]
MYPDIVVYKNNEPYCIIDIKYKEVENKPLQSDLYQMLAYSCTVGCPEVHLLYPAGKNKFDPIEIDKYPPVKIKAHTLNCCVDDKNKENKLQKCLSDFSDSLKFKHSRQYSPKNRTCYNIKSPCDVILHLFSK